MVHIPALQQRDQSPGNSTFHEMLPAWGHPCRLGRSTHGQCTPLLLGLLCYFWHQAQFGRVTRFVSDQSNLPPPKSKPKPTPLSVPTKKLQLSLKEALAAKIPGEVERINRLKKDFPAVRLGDVLMGQVFNGMRGIRGLVYDLSLIDPYRGIVVRGLTIPELRKKLPHVENEPLPEGMFWFILTGEVPVIEQVNALSEDWSHRAFLPDYVLAAIHALPQDIHPMVALSYAITLLSRETTLSHCIGDGMSLDQLWGPTYEDAMDLLARLPLLLGAIYQKLCRGKMVSPEVDTRKDWTANLVAMLALKDQIAEEFVEFMRLYLTIHCDHEGGSACAYASHLVSSSVNDCCLSMAAGISMLQGHQSCHGRGGQNALEYLHKLTSELGQAPTDDQLKDHLRKCIGVHGTIPGYGHPLLRKTDPRFAMMREFAKTNLPEDPTFKLVDRLFAIVPPLLELRKVKNPWPKMDAVSGCILHHYGLKEMQFYSVVFSMSRCIGPLAWLIWSRVLNLPQGRPKSCTIGVLEHIAKIT